MKFVISAFLCALVAAAVADVSHLPANEYLPPAASAPEPVYAASNIETYEAPAVETFQVAASEPVAAHELSSDGYRYRTQRRRVIRRHRRDVSHLPANEYLPPAASAPEPEYLAPAVETVEYAASEPVAAHELSSDGYRYRTQRRRVIRRHRRDVSHLPANEYLPPAASAPEPEYLAPAVETVEVAASEPVAAHELSSDGYRYRTQRRRVIRRHRRDVSHLPANEYLPPAASAPEPEYLAPSVETVEVAASEPVAAHELSSDGYRYRTQRRRVIRRHRRDVSHLPANEYLPPAASAPEPEYLAPAVETVEVAASEPVAAHELSSDGYRYRTQRRRVIRRHRREVGVEYLPPFQGAASAPAPSAEYLPPVASAAAASVSQFEAVPSFEYAESAPSHSYSANDGYRYRTLRRRVYRRHR